MYPNNTYIKHHEEIRAITHNGKACTIGVQLDIFDDKHGLKHDDLARAQYKKWLGVELSVEEKKLLHS